MKRKSIKLVFYIYILFLLVFVVFKINCSISSIWERIQDAQYSRELGGWNCNLVLFRTIKSQIEDIEEIWALKNIAANVLVFVPFGFLVPVVYPKFERIIRVFVVSFIFVLCIEAAQFFTMLGSFDVDDILLNVIGSMIGYTFLRILHIVCKDKLNKRLW